MKLPSHALIYESIGNNYSQLRIPDRRIADQIDRALGNSKSVCNVGAGTGSYEPQNRLVVAVEPSGTMLAQRRNSNQVVQACAEKLPFADHEFDVAMAILTVHHWSDVKAGLKEMGRISARQVVLTFDVDLIDSLWLVRDYLPEVFTLEKSRAIPVKQIRELLHPTTVEQVLVPHDCTDGFQAAYWRRPQAYLDQAVRGAISSIAQLPQEIITRAMLRLESDLDSGLWYKRNAELLQKSEMDFGYRLIVSQ